MSQETAPAAPERRVRPRYRYSLQAVCRVSVPQKAEPEVASVQNISAHGAGIISGIRMAPGTGLAVELRSPNWQFALSLGAEVRHSTTLPDNRWLLGCAFQRELTEDELLKVLF